MIVKNLYLVASLSLHFAFKLYMYMLQKVLSEVIIISLFFYIMFDLSVLFSIQLDSTSLLLDII